MAYKPVTSHCPSLPDFFTTCSYCLRVDSASISRCSSTCFSASISEICILTILSARPMNRNPPHHKLSVLLLMRYRLVYRPISRATDFAAKYLLSSSTAILFSRSLYGFGVGKEISWCRSVYARFSRITSSCSFFNLYCRSCNAGSISKVTAALSLSCKSAIVPVGSRPRKAHCAFHHSALFARG